MRRTAHVVAIIDAQQCEIDIQPLSACGRCVARRSAGEQGGAGCGVTLLPGIPLRLICDNPVGAQPGDLVALDCAGPPAGWLRLVLVSYGWPLLGLVLGSLFGHALATVFAGNAIALDDALSVTGALGGLVAGRIASSWHACVLTSLPQMPDQVARIIAIEACRALHD